MHIHACPLDRQCRSYGAPPRLYINKVFGYGVTIALWPSGTSQEWRPSTGFTKRWRWATVRPPNEKMCCHNGGPYGCGKLLGHSGEHAPPLWE